MNWNGDFDEPVLYRSDTFVRGEEVVGHVPGPREMPDLRLRLLDAWDPSGMFARVIVAKRAEDVRLGLDIPAALTPDAIVNYVGWEQRTLRQAALWWVAEPMVDLLEHAAASIPLDLRLTELPDAPPALATGFALFERPLRGTTADTGDPIETQAIAWGPVKLSGRHVSGAVISGHGYAVSSYGTFDIGMNEGHQTLKTAKGEYIVDPKLSRRGDVVWWPQGRTDWPEEHPLGSKPWTMSDEALDSFMEDRRLLAALWLLLHQEGIASAHVDRQARPVRRRTERRGIPADLTDVRIVNLRVRHRTATTEGTGTGRKLDHRVFVSGHSKYQPYGPNRSLRKLIWVDPYLKGPGEGDVEPPEVVRVWKR